MATQNNDVLGYVKCEAGNRASVHQTKRGKGRYLYTRCDCCGCDQRNGAVFQTRLFNSTEWIGDKPEAPPNYVAGEPVVQPPEPSSDVVLPPIGEPEGDREEPKKEPVMKQEKVGHEPKGSSIFLVVGGLLLGVAAIAIGRAA